MLKEYFKIKLIKNDNYMFWSSLFSIIHLSYLTSSVSMALKSFKSRGLSYLFNYLYFVKNKIKNIYINCIYGKKIIYKYIYI